MKRFVEEKIAVKCETKEELKEFLERCEKEGLEWNSGNSAREYMPDTMPVELLCGYNSKKNKKLSWDFPEEEEWKVITYKEYFAEQITITRHGDKVVAKYGNKVGVAKCSPEDEFNFEVGAKLALERLFEVPSTYREVNRQAKVGEYIKIKWPWGNGNDYKSGDIFKVRKVKGKYGVYVFGHTRYISDIEYVVLEDYKPKKEFKPYLSGLGKNYGYIGEETDMTAAFGEKLYVGDVVELYSRVDKNNLGQVMVVKTDDGVSFVSGCKGLKFEDGIASSMQIRKVKSYKDLKHGEIINKTRVVLKDEKL